MSTDRVARSVALEQAYVYDVYEQLDESCGCSKCGNKPWPRVQDFLGGLEAGSIVCDVGSGNGKYLNLNASVYTIGGDRSAKHCEMTKTPDKEVIMLDNLSLPYRDESLDGILSIAVIHHFTTTERRVCALRELARVLRIGGRIIISVWAMEQSSHRFESQDVLVPVPWTVTPSTILDDALVNSNDNQLVSMDYHGDMIMDVAGLHSYSSSKALEVNKKKTCSSSSSSSNSSNNNNNNNNNISSGSPLNSSSLSSPNETCYSFVRKAIQKLASGRPSSSLNQTSGRRPWFLDGWGNCAKDLNASSNRPEPRYDPDGCECYAKLLHVQDLPIELRRVDDEGVVDQQLVPRSDQEVTLPPMFPLRIPDSSVKSQTMSNASESTTFSTMTTVSCNSSTCNSTKRHAKPKLVKQKQSICQDDLNTEEALDQHTDMLTVRKQRPVFKQRSLNDEHLMNSNARTLEKEKLKHHFQKQTSLNDELIYQQYYSNSGGDQARGDTSFFSARRLQLIKTGFANKLKTSTTNIEKVTAGSFKNGFVKILQNWNISTALGQEEEQQQQKRDCADGCERRLSKEEGGSDSSKDSSLQSDTSVDSEDSFASVIFIPKSNSISPMLSPPPRTATLNYSMPNSPRIKQSSCPTSPKIHQMPLSIYPPLIKQLSSPKPTTKDTTLILHQTSKSHSAPQDTTTSTLATKYSVQQIPKFRNSPTDMSQGRKSSTDITDKPTKYPIVRNVSLYGGARHVTKPLPKLLSLELFNPETDDKDSDSSAISSPDSVESVVSVQYKNKLCMGHNISIISNKRSGSIEEPLRQQHQILFEAAVEVAQSLDNAVDKVIRRSNKCDVVNTGDTQSVMERTFLSESIEPWNKECQKHLTDFADRLTEKLHLEINRFHQSSERSQSVNKLNLLLGVSQQDPYIHRLSEELYDLSKLNEEIRKQNEYLARLSVSDDRLKHYHGSKCTTKPMHNSCCCQCRHISDKFLSSGSVEQYSKKNSGAELEGSLPPPMLPPNILDSMESSKASSFNSMFGDNNSAYSGSTASLASCPDWKTQRNLLQAVERSASTDNTSPNKLANGECSDGTSQESLPSDGGTIGGEITYHRFYHVFREHELDQLIEKYVENLHIISSYYDHASWCIVAEKVHVWTI